MFLVYENKEPKVSIGIGWVLRAKHKNIIKPKNIHIYSSKISQADTAYILRGIIQNRVVYYPKCVLGEFFNFYFNKNQKQKGVIFVLSQREIERIIDMIDSNDYKIIEKKKIIFIKIKS